MKITATVISLNEERRIGAALESLAWADEIVVVDSGSTDRTIEIASGFTDRVLHNPWPGYAAQKNHAAAAASNDWIFSLDADEVVTESLAASIRALRDGSPGAPFWSVAERRIPRKGERRSRLRRWCSDRRWRLVRDCGLTSVLRPSPP